MKIALLHGALGAGEQLAPLAETLKSRGFSPVALELPGHGHNIIGNMDFSMEAFSTWLEETMDQKELWGAPFFGFSMGGFIMLHLLSKKSRPEMPVITLGTKFNWNPETAKAEVGRLNVDKILEKVPKFAAMLDTRHKDWKQVMSSTRKLMLNLGEKTLLDEKSIATIKNKVLIMRGSSDQMVSMDESSQIADWLPNGRYKELAGIPHPLEQVPPNNIANEIENFINSEG